MLVEEVLSRWWLSETADCWALRLVEEEVGGDMLDGRVLVAEYEMSMFLKMLMDEEEEDEGNGENLLYRGREGSLVHLSSARYHGSLKLP